MRRNYTALKTDKSYCYVTKKDLVNAFPDDSILVVKDAKEIKLQFLTECKGKSLLFSSLKDAELRNLQIIGDVVRPTQVKLVNTVSKANDNANELFCLENDHMAEDAFTIERPVKKHKQLLLNSHIHTTEKIKLFQRRFRVKSYIEMEDKERDELATILIPEKYKGKSMFQQIQEKELLMTADYSDPDFISIEPPIDVDYEQSYSINAPSVHELFDFEAEPHEEEEYEMVEFLEDEVIDL